jgi:hypothetical protein
VDHKATTVGQGRHGGKVMDGQRGGDDTTMQIDLMMHVKKSLAHELEIKEHVKWH